MDQSPRTPSNMGADANQGSTANKRDGTSNKKGEMRPTHSPTRFVEVIEKLKASKPHVDAIEAIGFGGLLEMPDISVRKRMLQDLADTYQVSNQGFNLCGRTVYILPEDVENILGLQITGLDVYKHINLQKKWNLDIMHSEFFNKFADSNHKLELLGLQGMLKPELPADDDFKRAFVLFTIGVILASPTGSNIHWSYIELVRDVSKIPCFDWGNFTLQHLLRSCSQYHLKGDPLNKTLKGNLSLLQFWYWERVRVDPKYKVGYNDKPIKTPRMVFWNEETIENRMNAWTQEGIHGGTLHVSHNTAQKNVATEASTSQVPQVKCAQKGPTIQEVQGLEQWKSKTERKFTLQAEENRVRMQYEMDLKLLEQKKEFANFGIDGSQEDRISKLEADNIRMSKENERMSMEIQELHRLVGTLLKQSTCSFTQFQSPMPSSTQVHPRMPTYTHVQEPPFASFHRTRDQINDELSNLRSGTTEKTMEQKGDPYATYIKPRTPIIDKDFTMTAIDHEAALFVKKSYDYAQVVDIGDDYILTAQQLRRNVSQQWIIDEVINAYVHFSKVENDSASFIRTFDVQILAKDISKQRGTFKERIANKCKGKHLVFVPMNINQNHWGLLVLNFIKEEVQILDSLRIRDKVLEKSLVEGIQSCIECSVNEGLVQFKNPINLRKWEIVPYDSIPKQRDKFSCGAFLIQYILAWDGVQMAHDFSNWEMEGFCYRICTKLLHSDCNKKHLDSYATPLTREAYLAKFPDAQDDDQDELEILSSSTETEIAAVASKKEIAASSAPIVKKGRRKAKEGVEKNAASVGGEENIASEATIKRPRGRPRGKAAPKRIVQVPPVKEKKRKRSVIDQFSTDSIAKQVQENGGKRARRGGPYGNREIWGE